MKFTYDVPDRPVAEWREREDLIGAIEGYVGTLEVEWCTMTTDSMRKLWEYIRRNHKE